MSPTLVATTDDSSRPGHGRAGTSDLLRVFLAEDDDEMRALLAQALRSDGHEVFEARDGNELAADLGCALWSRGESSGNVVIVSDARMPGRGGLSVLRGMRHHPICPPFIVITAFGDDQLLAEARRLRAHAVLSKPFDIDELRGLIQQIARGGGGTIGAGENPHV